MWAATASRETAAGKMATFTPPVPSFGLRTKRSPAPRMLAAGPVLAKTSSTVRIGVVSGTRRCGACWRRYFFMPFLSRKRASVSPDIQSRPRRSESRAAGSTHCSMAGTTPSTR